jgi:hypothetical protein
MPMTTSGNNFGRFRVPLTLHGTAREEPCNPSVRLATRALDIDPALNFGVEDGARVPETARILSGLAVSLAAGGIGMQRCLR